MSHRILKNKVITLFLRSVNLSLRSGRLQTSSRQNLSRFWKYFYYIYTLFNFFCRNLLFGKYGETITIINLKNNAKLHFIRIFLSAYEYGSSRSQIFFKICVLKNFAIFTRKPLCLSLF